MSSIFNTVFNREGVHLLPAERWKSYKLPPNAVAKIPRSPSGLDPGM